MLQALRDIDQPPAALAGGQAPVLQSAMPRGPRRLGLLPTLGRHALLAAIIFGTVAGAGGVAVMKRFAPVYAAEAVFHVAPMPPRILYTDAEWHNGATISFFEDYARTLTHVVRMRSVLADAIDRLEAAGVAWAHPHVERERWVAHLRSRLRVTDILDTHLISIRLEDEDPLVVQAVVEHVAAAFVEHVATEMEAVRLKQVRVLEAQRDDLRERLAKRQRELNAISAELGAPLLDDRRNVFYERILKLDEGMTKVFLRRVHAQGDHTKATGRASDLNATVPTGEVALAMEEDRGLRDARRTVSRETKLRDEASKRYREQHPTMVDRENARQAAERAVDRVEEEAFKRHYERIRSTRAEVATDLIKQSNRELEAARMAEAEMQQVLKEAQEGLKRYESARIEGTKVRREADDTIDMLSRTNDRLEQLHIEASAPPRTQLRSPAVVPLAPVRDPRKVMGFGVLGLAALLALLGTFLAESRWPKILTADDADRWGLSVFADVSNRTPETAGTDLALRLRRAPDRSIAMVPATRGAARMTARGHAALAQQVQVLGASASSAEPTRIVAADVGADSLSSLREGARGSSALIWISRRGAPARDVVDIATRWEAVGGRVLGTVFGGEQVRPA